jgi:hypothetical protein
MVHRRDSLCSSARWVVTFLAITATVYGKFAAKALGALLGALLGGVAIYTFWVPIIILATGRTIP